MLRRRLLSIVGALGLVTGLLSSGVAAQAANSMSDSDFQSMVNFYTAIASYGGTFCYAQPSSTTACPTLTQATSTSQNKFAICVENTTATPSATETCDITQTNGSGHNIAIIIQRIRQNAATVDGHQNGFIRQVTTGAGANLAATVQVISQQFGNRDEDPTQQDSQFSSTNQTSTSGHNFKLLAQSSQQDAQSALGGTQNSSEDGTINQHSTGVSTALAFQNQHQGLTGGGTQTQTIDPRCCSFQDTNPNDVFQITQKADQHGDSLAPVQSSSTIGQCDSAGQCTIDQTATTNGDTNHNHLTCTGSCSTAITCTTTQCTPCTPAPSEGTCVVILAPVASLSSHSIVAVRGSVFASSRSASRYGTMARSAPSVAVLT